MQVEPALPRVFDFLIGMASEMDPLILLDRVEHGSSSTSQLVIRKL
jgi:hypothetical protein